MRNALALTAGALAVVAAVAAVALLHRPPARGDASDFLASVVRLQLANRFGDAWTTLNPAHQQVAPRRIYVACERSRAVSAQLVSLRVVDESPDRVVLTPGETVDAVAVTFDADVRTALGDLRLVLHRHAVPAGSRWTWILAPARYAEYRRGLCKA